MIKFSSLTMFAKSTNPADYREHATRHADLVFQSRKTTDSDLKKCAENNKSLLKQILLDADDDPSYMSSWQNATGFNNPDFFRFVSICREVVSS